MGEDEAKVFHTGALGVHNILNTVPTTSAITNGALRKIRLLQA
jgi:hypothetical protein